MWEEGPPLMSPSPNCSSTGRAPPGTALSVTMISAIGWASRATSSQMPSDSNMRRAAAVMAEARPSKALVEKARGSLASTTTTSSGTLHVVAAKGERRGQPVEGRADDDDVI